MAKCLICKKSFGLDKELHMHLRSHGIRMAEYYQKYFPRKDLHDGEIIKFKNKEYYFSRDFNTKTNLKSWLKKQNEEKKKEYCSNLIRKRIEEKKNTSFSDASRVKDNYEPSGSILQRPFR